ncbi:MAG: hypothetical protein H0V94_01530 [Actinobacteria bacterium]|nr:hypothetical protein [Actinomycetota bacterium]
MPTSAATDLWDVLAGDAAAESPLWAEALLPAPERELRAIFSPLAPERFALALETIYEGYLVHYGRSRLFEPADEHEAVLLGDYLFAHGLVRVASLGETEAVAVLADLISHCAHLRAEGAAGDGEAWVEAATRLRGSGDVEGVAAAAASALLAHVDRFG